MLTSDVTRTLWTRGVESRDLAPATVEGTLPADLRGTLYRNGPGQFEQFGVRYAHPFEADGAITAARFDRGAVSAGSRVHDTAGLRAERDAGKVLYGFGLPWLSRVRNNLRGRGKNTANTSVMWHNGRLYALMEAGKPTEVDPITLRTIGESDLGGVVTSWFSAHPHRVAKRRTTYNFGLEYGRHNRLHVYAMPDDAPARKLTVIDLAAVMLHDFIATDDHLVFFVSPARVVVKNVLLGLGGFEDMFAWRPELGTEVIVVPIDDPAALVRFETDAFYQWHFANAVSKGDEIHVEYCRYPDFASFHEIGTLLRDEVPRAALSDARYHRAIVNLRAKTLRSEALMDETSEFPRVHPAVEGAAHRYTWMTLGNLDGLGRLDVTTGELAAHRLPGHQRTTEPIFAPRQGATDEGDGHVLALCFDAARDESFVAVYDGLRLADGPVAKVWLGYAVPITFHGIWVPA